jgi:hypothetical protein
VSKKKTRTLKIGLALFIVTTIGLLSVAYFKYRRILDKPEQFITAIQPGVDMAIDDIHQTATRDGKKEWQLDADTAHYLEAEKKNPARSSDDDLFYRQSTAHTPVGRQRHPGNRNPQRYGHRPCRIKERRFTAPD